MREKEKETPERRPFCVGRPDCQRRPRTLRVRACAERPQNRPMNRFLKLLGLNHCYMAATRVEARSNARESRAGGGLRERMGLRLSMTNFQFARQGRRALLVGFTAFAAASGAMTPLAIRAEEGLGGQAEWRQSYETSESISVSRETTPVLSSA